MARGFVGIELANLEHEVDHQQALAQAQLARASRGAERSMATTRSVLLDEASLRIAQGRLSDSRGDFDDARRQLRAALGILAGAPGMAH